MVFDPTTEAFPRGFASDNFAGIHPKVLAHIAAVNHGHAMAYGDDAVTARARKAFLISPSEAPRSTPSTS